MVQESMTLYTGLLGDTPVIIDSDVISMRQAALLRDGIVHRKTLAVDKDFKITTASIYKVQETYVTNTWDFCISSGLHFECTPTTLILTPTGMKEVRTIAKGDQIWGVISNSERGVEGGFFDVVVSEPKQNSIMQQAFYFASSHQNILIPQKDEQNNNLILVCVHQ